MPIHAHVQFNLKCPTCGTTAMYWDGAELVDFQWGHCPGRLPQEPYIYQVGDPIRWRTCPDGSVPEWVFFMRDGYLDGGNAGYTAVRNLIVRDSNEGYGFIKSCESCGKRFTGAAVEIREGVIKQVWLCGPGQASSTQYSTEGGLLLLPGELTEAEYDKLMSVWRRHNEEMDEAKFKLQDELLWKIFYRPTYYLIESDHSLKAMPEWNDFPMPKHLNSDCIEVDPRAKPPSASS